MKHKFNLEGYNYRLRPIKLSDAEFNSRSTFRRYE